MTDENLQPDTGINAASPDIRARVALAQRMGQVYVGVSQFGLSIDDPRWQKDALEPIEEFLRTLQRSKDLYARMYPGQVERLVGVQFIGIEDDLARGFLSDILWVRSLLPGDTGYISSEAITPQADAMRSELGGQIPNPVTFDDLLVSVESGELSLAPSL